MTSKDPSSELLAKYKKALSHAKMGLWEIDFTTQVLSWDEGLQKLYENENKGFAAPIEFFYQRVHTDDSLRIRTEIENAHHDLDDLDSLFRITLEASGKEKFIRTKATKVRNNKNEVIGLSGVNWDVTSEHKLQEDLEKTKIFLEKIIEAIPDPVFIKDSQHRTIFANRAFELICGKEKNELIGKLDSDFLPQEIAALYWQQDNEVLNGNKSFEFEEMAIIPNGEKRQLLTKKSSVKISDKEKIIIGVIRDITEIKDIQKSLIEQSKMASLGEMAAGIAHEINNPLMIIQAKSQLLQVKFEKKSEEIDFFKLSTDLQAIELNSMRIDKIIKSLKSVSRKSNADPLEEVSIRRIIEETVEISKERFHKSDIVFGFYFDEIIDYNYNVKARSSEIVQVLVNLLNNSFDAVKSMSNAWVRINLVLLDATFKIEVVDSGEMIKTEVAMKMMEPFFTTKKTGSGTGLGLSVSKQIIKNHNGDLYYDSQSENTKFVFHLKRSESISKE